MSDDVRRELATMRAYRSRLIYFEFTQAATGKDRQVVMSDIGMATARIRQLETSLKLFSKDTPHGS